MIEALLHFLVLVIVVIVVAGIILWAVRTYFAELYPPARLIVGAGALIVILYGLLRLVQSGGIPGI